MGFVSRNRADPIAWTVSQLGAAARAHGFASMPTGHLPNPAPLPRSGSLPNRAWIRSVSSGPEFGLQRPMNERVPSSDATQQPTRAPTLE
jgi:hypothetical protein